MKDAELLIELRAWLHEDESSQEAFIRWMEAKDVHEDHVIRALNKED